MSLPSTRPGFSKPFRGPAMSGFVAHHYPVNAKGEATGSPFPVYPKDKAPVIEPDWEMDFDQLCAFIDEELATLEDHYLGYVE